MAGSSNITRRGTTRYNLVKVAPAAATNYLADIPAGTYYLNFTIEAEVTGTTSTISYWKADSAGASIGATGAIPFVEADDTVPAATAITLPAAAIRHSLQAVPYVVAAAEGPVIIAHGVVVSWIQGTAVAGEELVLDVWATPV